MCGIAGFFTTNRISEASVALDRMLQAIAHRGPDGNGQACFDNAGLGHVRLAIIDIEGGLQPMCSEDKRYWISYNGELYNYREIREELRCAGLQFQTNSDTEVVLSAFQHLGTKCLQKFRGMFAFAIWDDLRKEGFLVRDRIGIKPLFYTTYGNQLIFGSEIKALITFPGISKTLDPQSLHLLMNFRYIPEDKTLFQNIFHLQPGHFIRWHDGHATPCKWSKERQIHTTIPSIDKIRTTLETAVRRQLISDVPLGGYLSAGIDSATILALSLRNTMQGSKEFPTFTIKTGDSPLEHVHAAETAQFFSVQNFQGGIETNLGELLPRLIWHLEVPKVNAYQSALVARLARQHVKVALSGLGGDEIFLGYNIHRYLDRLYNIQRKTGAVLGYCGKIMHPIFSKWGLYFEEYARGSQALAALPDFLHVYGIIRNIWDSPDNRKRIYGQRMIDNQPADAFSFLENSWEGHGRNPVESCAAFELKNKMVNDLLLQEDRLSMAFGLEVRVPFLDEDLVDLVTGIPSTRRMPGGQLKGLMKTAVAQWLPQEILARPKSGFQLPIHQVFDTHLKPLADEYLSPERLKSDGLFNLNFVTTVLKAKPDYRLRWHYFMLYLMIGTNIWIDLFEKDESPPPWS